MVTSPRPPDALLDTPIEGLLSTPTARLPYQANVLIRSFLLVRPSGNVIVYNSPGLAAAAPAIKARGGVARLLINHGHEAMYGDPPFSAPTWMHRRDRAEAGRRLTLAGTFKDRQMIDDDLEVIPTPGHTAGTTSYLWSNGRHRFLFTGDFLWIEHGEWKAVVLDGRLRRDYVRSLELIGDLDFDVLVPWGATDDGPAIHLLAGPGEARERLADVIRRVRSGESR